MYIQKFAKEKNVATNLIPESYQPYIDRTVNLHCFANPTAILPLVKLPGYYDPCWEIYDPDGIVKFFNLLFKNKLMNKNPEPGNVRKDKVFVVAHSNIMKSCLQNSFKLSKEHRKELKSKVYGMNGWTLTLHHIKQKIYMQNGNLEEGYLIPFQYTEGVLKTPKSDVELDKEYLCNQDQSHWDIMRGRQYGTVGGKRSKRRFRSKRRKHNRSFR